MRPGNQIWKKQHLSFYQKKITVFSNTTNPPLVLVGVRVIFSRKFGGFGGRSPPENFDVFTWVFKWKNVKFLIVFIFFLYINPLHCLIYSLTKVRNQSLNFCFLWYFLARANDNFLLTFSRNQSIFHHQKFNNISSWLGTKSRNLFALKVMSR